MILVITEHREGKLTANSNELIVFAQRAGRDIGMPVQALVLGAADTAVEAVKAAKIDRILRVSTIPTSTFMP